MLQVQRKRTSLQHLSELIVNITSDYFNPRLPLSIQTPSAWNCSSSEDLSYHFEIDFFEMLNKECVIPYIVLSNTEYLEEVGFNKMKSGSHILLLSISQVNLLVDMLIRIRHDARNPTARTLIAVLEPLEMTRKTVELPGRILTSAWIYAGLTDALVIMQIRESQDEVNFCLVTWQPEDQENICSMKLNQLQAIDFGKMEYSHLNINLYPSKELRNMNNCDLIVRLHDVYPIASSIGGKVSGSLPLFIDAVAGLTNFNTLYKDESVNFDIIVPGVYDERFEECSLTYPHIKSELTWFVPSGETMPRWLGLIKVFEPGMWILVGFTFILGSVTFWLLSTSTSIVRNAQMRPGLSVVLMDSLLSHLGMSMHCRFKGPVATIFLSLWLFYCLQIYVLYQSSLIGFLVNPGQLPPISSVEELKESGLPMFTLANVSGSIREIMHLDAHKICTEEDRCLQQVAIYRNSAVFDVRFHAEYLSRLSYSEGGKTNIVALEENLFTVYFGVTVEKFGCLMHSRMEKIQQRLVSAGLLDKWLKNSFAPAWTKYYQNIDQGLAFSFKILHLQGAFYVLLIGLSLGVFIFIVELLCKYF